LADYEKFYPKEKKEVPKENDKKFDSKGKHGISCIHPVIFSIRKITVITGVMSKVEGVFLVIYMLN